MKAILEDKNTKTSKAVSRFEELKEQETEALQTIEMGAEELAQLKKELKIE
tara:strand:+ start:262 stop:414 length:153 start_codon:yes stop_codon:yes gene_type:complete